MKRGLNSLASIAATAPLVGLFGTVSGTLNAFTGGILEKSSYMRVLAESFSESLVPTVLGLLVAVLASCFYKYLLARLENLDVEIQHATLELVYELAHV
jgi:biopolymer transport protein ExbB/TolQ